VSEHPAPVADDDDTRAFWDAARRGAIAVQFCAHCERSLHLPRPYCSACGSWDVVWRDVAPRAHVYSWTVSEHQVHPSFPAPYTIALVELDEVPGVRLITHMEGTPAIEVGTPMRATFQPAHDGVIVPMWEPDLQHSAVDPPPPS
jgi:uncharacterized OB-fold protein